ncbi:MAG: hypothetical protein JW951_06650 [Lentisphaerae bacterium]|nr:hypothetical protein [Lentisphaerota bacterium]
MSDLRLRPVLNTPAALLLAALAAGLPALLNPPPGAAALAPGDVYITGFNADGSDGFAFMALADIPAAETLLFTDRGWSNNTFWTQTSEGALRYRPPASGLPAGTVVVVSNLSAGTAACDLGAVEEYDAGFNLSASGDQILAYQTNAAGPRFLFALSTCSTAWQEPGTPIGSNASEIPPGLLRGVQAVHAAAHLGAPANSDCGRYTNGLCGLPADMRARLRNGALWTFTEDGPYTLSSADAVLAEPLAFQGFENGAADTWTIESCTGNVTNDPGATGSPPGARIRTGQTSCQTCNGSTELILGAVSWRRGAYRDLAVTLHVSAASTLSGSGGVDQNDYVKVFVATGNAAFAATPDIMLGGPLSPSSNARWRYHEAAAVTTALGHAVTNRPAAGGNRDGAGDGGSTLRVILPRAASSVTVRVTCGTDQPEEVWSIDDVSLTGTLQGGSIFWIR